MLKEFAEAQRKAKEKMKREQEEAAKIPLVPDVAKADPRQTGRHSSGPCEI